MKRMIIPVFAVIMALVIAGCTQREKRVAGYGVAGGAIGALAGGAIGKGRGALAGAAIGGAVGTYVGYLRTRNGVRYCRYKDRHGRLYEARCHRRR